MATRGAALGQDRCVSTTIYDLLDELRAASLDERDKGDKFEHLVKAYLLNDPEWAQKFTDVWLWSEWPGREGRPDIGIDLVAANRDDERLTAIQCKFYASGATVSKSAIDSFISASAGDQFTRRLIFDTSAGWSGNAEQTLVGVAQRVDISYLADAAIDWGQFSWTTPHVVVPTGKKALRPHQKRALDDVAAGLSAHDRGQLVMACGTGKTFTSLRIAENVVGEGGSVLFLVPSIQLLSQSLREWMANAEVDIRPFAVCSDVRVGRTVTRGSSGEDDADLSTIDLTEPATTSSEALLRRMSSGRHAPQRMTVVFATYQSIDVIVQAQAAGLGAFDLVICDEAHRTTGVTLSGVKQSAFVKVHDVQALKAAKRLYMTATPRVFGDDARRKAVDADAVLADMSDEEMFGPELHRLGFGEAVEADLLTDYKVLVLAVDQHYVAENFQQVMSESGELKLDETAKLLGCWNGLAKNFSPTTAADDEQDNEPGDERVGTAPMRTAVAFAQNIAASKAATRGFPAIVEQALADLPDGRTPLRIAAQHVDGTMGIQERNARLAWLKEDPAENVCRILTNARCLSEGVDVPALDAVLFLTPRGSQVDVVQSVGRVMRKAPGKELGYIILPVVVPSGVAPEDALADNERYKVVWQVLQALRSHDDRFHALVNQIELNKKKPSKIEIITVTGSRDTDKDGSSAQGTAGSGEGGSGGAGSGNTASGGEILEQTMLQFPAEAFRDAMYARIVAKVGERRYWETWAKDVADIAAAHTTRIRGLLADPTSNPAREFAEFLNGLRGNLNESITSEQAIEMLAQHLVTRPIFEALFEGYAFAATNPVARTMETMLSVLDEHNLDAENETLGKFYASVRRRVAGVDNAEGRQRILIELYDKFFATAFKKTVDKLGIVYTPVEIVDFILRSADDVMRAEFGQGLTDEEVHILDGFTGTGTFMVRLLQSGLIKPHDLARKYSTELHANEILLLAYYIAAVNIETTYQDLTGTSAPFPGLILTDTFQSWEPGDRPDLNVFPENNQRLERLKALPITVIVGNPPYSAGQNSANDDNANEKYPALDEEIRRTYAERSTATNKNALYDSYIRAIKWATLRIQHRGVIAFVTNGGFLDANTADGMRKTLTEEFSTIHVFNLRGNRRDGGAEGRPIWEAFAKGQGGSIATIAIVVLVKNPDQTEPCRVFYAQVTDHTTARQKVAEVVAAGSIFGTRATQVEPNEHGDWIRHRSPEFSRFLSIGNKTQEPSVFGRYSKGVNTARSQWAYSYGRGALVRQIGRLLDTYGRSVQTLRAESNARLPDDESQIKWSRTLEQAARRFKPIELRSSAVRRATFRPFQAQWLYFDRLLNDQQYSIPALLPTAASDNLGLVLTDASSHAPFSVIMIDRTPDLHTLDTGQFFARWRYEPVDKEGTLDFALGEEIVDGYRKIDNITDEALATFVGAYPGEPITKEDIFFYVYGLLHSTPYRTTYAADLKKVLPRIPIVATATDFRSFAHAGRRLADLHLNYETVKPYPLGGLDVLSPGGDDDYAFFAVGDRKMSFGPPKRSDKSVIQYNDRITLTGIPPEAYGYQLGSRSAIEWIIDRYYVKTDKASGIVNDPNDWSREVGNPRYILDLLARVVTVSVETMRIVDDPPPLDVKIVD